MDMARMLTLTADRRPASQPGVPPGWLALTAGTAGEQKKQTGRP
jgi:hypothetical protein